MTTGIYKIVFNGTDKVYIGKGSPIEHRWSSHKTRFLNNTHSKKMMEAYRLHGMPSLHILLECGFDELNDNENAAIEVFDAIVNGFNTLVTAESMPDGSSTPGELNGSSKYPNTKIIEVFKLLLNPDNTIKYISETSTVSYRVVAHIANLETHNWLEKEFPEDYLKLRKLKGTRFSLSNSAKGRGIKYPTILSPEGIEYEVTHLTNFCREHGLDPSTLSRMMKGLAKHHKKWTLKS